MSIDKPTLIVHTPYFPVVDDPADEAADPEHEAAASFGLDLYEILTRRIDDRLSWGAGVNVRIGTRWNKVDLDEATHVVVVPVLGAYSQENQAVRELAIRTIRGWREKTRVLPVLAATSWRAHENADELDIKLLFNPERDRILDEIVIGIARVLAGDDRYATRLFISHAKCDLEATEHAAVEIRDHVQSATTAERPFFDSVSLLAGEDLEAQIDDGAGHGVFMAVRGDSYSSRSWCLRELLKAKRRRLPVVTVEVLSRGEGRSFAYSGNGPTVVWPRGGVRAAAAKVVRFAMVECVRELLFMQEAKRVTDAALPGESVVEMPRAPELLDLPGLRAGSDRMVIVLHPDPELSLHERGLLLEADRRIRTVTPTTAFAGAIGRAIRAPLDRWQVALSISNDLRLDGTQGLVAAHADDATVFVARSLLGAGAAIGYGGDFRPNGFTELLAQLVSAYNQTARKPADLLHAYVAASVTRLDTWRYAYTAHSLGRFGSSQRDALLSPPAAGEVPPHREALYLSDMRRVMGKTTQARIVLGGKTIPKRVRPDAPPGSQLAERPDAANDPEGYNGRYPGVIEEAWWSLKANRPLYVVGGFGGAAQVLVELLETPAGEYPAALRESSWATNPTWRALTTALDGDPDVAALGLPPTQEALADDIRRACAPHLVDDGTALRWNGLTLDENRQLRHARDPLAIAALTLKGLVTLAAHAAADKLQIELVEGDVTAASDLDVLVFPTFSDLDPEGAGAALDRVSGNAATRAHRCRRPVPPATKALGTEFVYAADLGAMKVALKDPATSVTAAAAQTAEVAQRYGFARIGLVTFLGNVAESVAEVVAAMIAGLRGIKAQIIWFERDSARAAMLARLLGAMPDVELTRVVPAVAAIPEPPRDRPRTIVSIRQDAGEIDVTVLVPQANGLAPNLRTPFDADQRAILTGNLAAVTPALSVLATGGTTIAGLMFGLGATSVLDAVGDSELVILHDSASSAVPYESLGWGAGDGRTTPATRGGIVRHLVTSVDPNRGIPGPTRVGDLGVLVVIDPQGNLPGAAAEGETVAALLDATPRIKVDVLRGTQATVEAVLAKLRDAAIDVIHYCGHAFYRGPGPEQSGLCCADADLTIKQLQTLTRVPRLAVFNACQAGRVRGAPDAHSTQTFAEFFLQAGVEAYLGTFWLVSDDGALMFARELYRHLASGVELGEAVTLARRELQTHSQPDWANYMLYGRSGFRLVRAEDRAVPPAPPSPSSWARAEGNTIIGCWSFPATSAPATFAVTATERIGDTEDPVATEDNAPIRIDRRDGWEGGIAMVSWVATIALTAPVADRGFRLRASAGAPIEIGTPRAAPTATTRAPRSALDELRGLRTVLDQQADHGRTILTELQPSADPDQLRAEIDLALAVPTRTVWPLQNLAPPPVDEVALAAFAAQYPLSPTDAAVVADQRFQTKEDWIGYATAKGVVPFLIGADVNRPLAADLSPSELTYDLRPAELDGGSLSVALFSDNCNGRHPALAIASQIAAAKLPYAFHLGDVYYGGTKDQFTEYFQRPIEPMFEATELFALSGNHEMFARGEWFQQMLLSKLAKPRQRQRAETFRLRGPGFQIIGLDTMFVGWNAGRMRIHDSADEGLLQLLDGWLAERPDDLTVLLTTNEPWNLGSKEMRPLYQSLRRTIAGRVDLWFWGNVHYGALYGPWGFADTGAQTRKVVGSCIGHGGYPFYTERTAGPLPPGVTCRWLETKSRFWPDDRIRPDVGLNGWCKMTLTPGADRWRVGLCYLDWVGRERLRVELVRERGRSIELASVMESSLAAVGAPLTWAPV